MSVDDLDLSGAARAAAVLTRHRLVTLAEEITAETDPARIRDISIGLAALAAATVHLDAVAEHATIHRAALSNWADSLERVSDTLGAGDQGEALRDRALNEIWMVIDALRSRSVPS